MLIELLGALLLQNNTKKANRLVKDLTRTNRDEPTIQGQERELRLSEDQGTSKRRAEHCAELNSYKVTGVRGIERFTRSQQ